MPILYSDTNGALVRLSRTLDEIAAYGDPPDFVYKFEYDDLSNPGLSQDITDNWDSYVLIGSALTKDGVDITVQPFSLLYIFQAGSLDNLKQAIHAGAELPAVQQALDLLWSGSMSQEQQSKVLAYCVLKLNIDNLP